MSGIGANEQQINAGIQSVSDNHPESGVPWSWGNDELMTLAGTIRSLIFPISIAANKADCVTDEGIWNDLSNII